jgi:hypothetical protein
MLKKSQKMPHENAIVPQNEYPLSAMNIIMLKKQSGV